jgi:hypothetical protein
LGSRALHDLLMEACIRATEAQRQAQATVSVAQAITEGNEARRRELRRRPGPAGEE